MTTYHYNPDHGQKLVNFVKEAGSPLEAYSAECNIPYSVLLQWKEEHIEFANHFELATAHFLKYWSGQLALALLAGDATSIAVIKSNIDRYYRIYGDNYTIDFNQNNNIKQTNTLSEEAGTSFNYE